MDDFPFFTVIFLALSISLGIAGFDDDVTPEVYQAAEAICAANDGVAIISGYGFFGGFVKHVRCNNGGKFKITETGD